MLDVPAQHHLSGGLSVLRPEPGDDRVLERAPRRAPISCVVERRAPERRPRLRDDTVTRVGGPHLPLDEERVQLHLVHGRHDLATVQEHVQMVRVEVGHTDRSGPLLRQDLLSCTVGGHRLVEGRGDRPMEQVQVHVVHAEPAETCVEGAEASLMAEVADPQLGGDEHFGPGDPAPRESFGHLALVEIRGSGVDEAVSILDRPLDRARRLLGRSLKDPEPESRHLDAVVQCEERSLPAHGGHLSRSARFRECKYPG